ncbi:MAG: hypothetical protein Q9184_004225 [Pyrenodesmia sp. 2 TL-2023]
MGAGEYSNRESVVKRGGKGREGKEKAREIGREERKRKRTHSLLPFIVHKLLNLPQVYNVYVVPIWDRVIRDIIQLVRNISQRRLPVVFQILVILGGSPAVLEVGEGEVPARVVDAGESVGDHFPVAPTIADGGAVVKDVAGEEMRLFEETMRVQGCEVESVVLTARRGDDAPEAGFNRGETGALGVDGR